MKEAVDMGMITHYRCRDCGSTDVSLYNARDPIQDLECFRIECKQCGKAYNLAYTNVEIMERIYEH